VAYKIAKQSKNVPITCTNGRLKPNKT